MVSLLTFKGETFTNVAEKIQYYLNSNLLKIKDCNIVITEVTIQGTYINDKPKTVFMGALYYDVELGIVDT